LLSSSAELARMPDDLDIEDVSALMRDSRGGLWIGTRSGDVVHRDLESLEDHHIFYGGARGTPRIILRFVEDLRGDIWIGTNGGVIRLDREGGQPLFLRHDPSDPASIGPGYVRAILADREGNIWVGTGEGGLQRLDAQGGVVDRYLHDPDDPETLGDNYVTCIRQDLHGILWVGTRSGGLSSLDPRTGRARRFLPDPGDESTISHHYLTSIMEDSSGALWIGTGGGGLNRLERSPDGEHRFTRFTEASGLIDDDVMGVLEDDDGSLWLSTKRGLTRFDPETGAYANFFAADGLPSGEFESAAVTRDASTLYFGSVKGLVAVPAGSPFPVPEASPTVVTSIKTSGRELHGDRPVWDLESLEVPWGDWLSLEFAVLDYSADHRHRYSYRLAADQEWIDLGSHREVTFTDLDPGIYEFAVRGRNSQGVWSLADSTLAIRVVPPFWMTGWFRALLAAAVVFFAVAGHRIRMSALQRRNKELLELTEQREKAREQLRQAFNRLRTLTRRLEAAKEDERKHIARELHDDMGPSLTAVIINLQLLANETDPEKKSVRTADTIELVDRMVQRIRDLSLDMRPPLLDELGLVPALSGYLETQASRAGIEIDVNDGPEIGRLTPEIEIAAFRVVQEAVTNVIRHARATKATVTVSRKNGRLELSVLDDGRGFEVGDTIDRAAAGQALGLLGMQERIGALGGELEISSNPGSGTLIRARLPLEALP
jgi:signal transduction histidine kinase/streptogramin lyase